MCRTLTVSGRTAVPPPDQVQMSANRLQVVQLHARSDERHDTTDHDDPQGWCLQQLIRRIGQQGLDPPDAN